VSYNVSDLEAAVLALTDQVAEAAACAEVSTEYAATLLAAADRHSRLARAIRASRFRTAAERVHPEGLLDVGGISADDFRAALTLSDGAPTWLPAPESAAEPAPVVDSSTEDAYTEWLYSRGELPPAVPQFAARQAPVPRPPSEPYAYPLSFSFGPEVEPYPEAWRIRDSLGDVADRLPDGRWWWRKLNGQDLVLRSDDQRQAWSELRPRDWYQVERRRQRYL
jgi:hypothetical protein